MTLDQEEFPTSETEEDRAKKPYVTPELVVHGAVEKITEGTNRGNQNDTLNNPRSTA
jgi:hypothetical protein